LDQESNSAKILIFFLIAIFAFGISNISAILTQDLFNFDYFNLINKSDEPSNILDSNVTPNDSLNFIPDSNTKNDSNNSDNNSNIVNNSDTTVEENTPQETFIVKIFFK